MCPDNAPPNTSSNLLAAKHPTTEQKCIQSYLSKTWHTIGSKDNAMQEVKSELTEKILSQIYNSANTCIPKV